MKKRTCLAACALAMAMSGCVMLPPPPPPPMCAAPSPSGQPPQFAPPPFASHGAMMPPPEHLGPPPQFEQACKDQAAGARVTLSGPRGEPLEGTCEKGPDGRIAFRPEPRQRP